MKIYIFFVSVIYLECLYFTNWGLDKDLMFILIFLGKIMTRPVGIT